ncbi:MAG: PP2C family protein-serine/threonine phosphatase, partial [Acidobacteriota bacterium]
GFRSIVPPRGRTPTRPPPRPDVPDCSHREAPGANRRRAVTYHHGERDSTLSNAPRASFPDRVGGFVRDFTDGLQAGDVQHLFGRDAARAYRVLTREHAHAPEPAGGVARAFYRAKILFLGLSYKLTPARRVLFVCAIGATLLGLVQADVNVDSGEASLRFGPFWFLASVAMLVFLLALELVDRVLVRDELEVARQLQKDLLPATPPGVPGYAFAHAYRTANEVGGDYYDYLPLPDGRLALVSGDASGHGMAAGLLMAVANTGLQMAVELDPSPARVAQLLNTVLWRTGDHRAFMSLFYGVLDPATGGLEYVCAGHPFPFLRRTDGAVEELGRGSFPLGVRESVEPTAGSVVLDPGDALLLYSDGLPEAPDPEGRPFGFDRVQSLFALGGAPVDVRQRLLAALDRHLAGFPLQDDFSLVVVARAGA